MKKKLDMENRVNATLNSLDDVQRATPGPFFFTRVAGTVKQGRQKQLGADRFYLLAARRSLLPGFALWLY